MHKGDLVEAVAKRMNGSLADAERGVNAVFEEITHALQTGEKVTLVGFGSFETRQRQARQGRNPQTGEPITIKASKTVGFKAGKALKDSVQGA